MKLKQAKGNTWYLEDWQLVPLYRLDGRRCILLDSGHYDLRRDIEDTLLDAGLTPVGIIGTHSHNDHSANHGYFQRRYHIPVALTRAEAAQCSSPEVLRSLFFMYSPGEFAANPQIAEMVFQADRIIGPEETVLDFCGARFGIHPLPGHSAGHIAVSTPDGALYLGDAIMTGADLAYARLPYHLDFVQALDSIRRLKALDFPCYLAAHKGVYRSLGDLPDRNIALIRQRAADVLAQLEEPGDITQIIRRVCAHLNLHGSSRISAAIYDRNIRCFLDYLIDTGEAEACAEDGILYYRKAQKSPPM